MEENAYILNLQLVGGYLDGESLTKGRPLDANPSACGHLINHSLTLSNVDFESFVWSDMILAADDELYCIYVVPSLSIDSRASQRCGA